MLRKRLRGLVTFAHADNELLRQASMHMDLDELEDADTLCLLAGLAASGDAAARLHLDDEASQESLEHLREPATRARLELLSALLWMLQMLVAFLAWCSLSSDSFAKSLWKSGTLDTVAFWTLSAFILMNVLGDVVTHLQLGGRDTPLRRVLGRAGVCASRSALLRLDWILQICLCVVLERFTNFWKQLFQNQAWNAVFHIGMFAGYRNLCDAYNVYLNAYLMFISFMVMSDSDTMVEMLMDSLALLFVLDIDAYVIKGMRFGIFGWPLQRMLLRLRGSVVVRKHHPIFFCEAFVLFFAILVYLSAFQMTFVPGGQIVRQAWVMTGEVPTQCLLCAPQTVPVFAPVALQGLGDHLRPGICNPLNTAQFHLGASNWSLFFDNGSPDAQGNASDLVVYASSFLPWMHLQPCGLHKGLVELARLPRTGPPFATSVSFERSWVFSADGFEETEDDFPPGCPTKVDHRVERSSDNVQTWRHADCWEAVQRERPMPQRIVIHLEASLPLPDNRGPKAIPLTENQSLRVIMQNVRHWKRALCVGSTLLASASLLVVVCLAGHTRFGGDDLGWFLESRGAASELSREADDPEGDGGTTSADETERLLIC